MVKKIFPILPAANTFVASGLLLMESQNKIYVRAVTGWFAAWRGVLVWVTQLVFYGLSWLHWNERQAVLLDLGTQRSFLFGPALYPQDLIYLVVLLMLAALLLFLVTVVAGRVWCGFACPQMVYIEMFLWVERHLEGSHHARKRLDATGWTAGKIYLSTPATANGMTRLDAIVFSADVAGLGGCEPAVDFCESPVIVDNTRELLSIGRRDDLHRATWCPTIGRVSERCPHVQRLNYVATR